MGSSHSHIKIFCAPVVWLTLIWLCSWVRISMAQVVLTEIMFNAANSESHEEFVEVLNLSQSEAVDLTGWRISDGSGDDEIVAHEAGLVLQPRQYGLILDASYFGNSITYDSFIDEASLILTIDNSTFGLGGLANAAPEAVALLDNSGQVVSTYTYTVPNPDGFSEEKIDVFGPDELSNWQNSRVFLGTPGGPNSPSLMAFAQGVVKINEIMHSPLSGQPEWVEIVNAGTSMIDITRWAISDSDTSARVFVAKPVQLQPDEFLVLAADSTILDFFNVPAGALFTFGSLPTLNGDDDSVVLTDWVGTMIDRVDYSDEWGGNNGFSLEKIRPNLASNDSSNWASSVVASGGTPGAQNSVFVEHLPQESNITIDPNPFSPDGDGRDDFTLISYELPLTTASVNIKIYDLRGRLIRYLANNRPAASQNTIVWDGRDDNGEIARIGIYVVFLQAINAQAGTLETDKKTVVLASNL